MEQTIVSLNNALFSYFGKSNYLFEVIYVYDCGYDNSWESLSS